ncbi:hypothetical protein [Janibacter sp. G1551]|uniref:hypothetical protein n=1 Tax=Janibacter sp. G1551 TaxID=3420440 RepID=UPI003CFE4A2A
MTVSTGAHLRTPTSTVEVVVVTAPSTQGELVAAGSEMSTEATPGPATAEGTAVLIGKRYTHAASGLEVLCVKGGPGPITFGGEELTLKSAKPLPASD